MKYFKEKNNYLKARFEFKDFQEALDFVNKLWNIAEQNNHHPDISILNYRFVEIQTTSHDANNTLTKKDFNLAKLIEDIYKK